jgi:hypothetical protein
LGNEPRWPGGGFTRVVMELADLRGHPARAIARKHKAAVEQRLTEALAVHGPAARERAREIMLLTEGAMARMLIHGDRSYAATAAAAVKALARRRPATPRQAYGETRLAADPLQRYLGEAVKAEHSGPRRRQIDYPAFDERATIIDAHDNAAAVALIGDANLRAERECAMCRRQRRRRTAFATRGFPAFIGID